METLPMNLNVLGAPSTALPPAIPTHYYQPTDNTAGPIGPGIVIGPGILNQPQIIPNPSQIIPTGIVYPSPWDAQPPQPVQPADPFTSPIPLDQLPYFMPAPSWLDVIPQGPTAEEVVKMLEELKAGRPPATPLEEIYAKALKTAAEREAAERAAEAAKRTRFEREDPC